MTEHGGRTRRFLVWATVLAVATGGAWYLIHTGAGPLPDPQYCEATAGGRSVELDLDQAHNASIIAGIGVDRGLPARAVSIALATAYQESKIHNVDHGDRDSLGLFQQRPSQGWGSASQVQDPVYATNAFYDALQRVDGYESMNISRAAQLVQHSADGSAYAGHEEDARVVASAMTGYSPASLTCRIPTMDASVEHPQANGLTRRANGVRGDLKKVFGELSLAVSTRRSESRVVNVSVRAVSAGRRTGWAIASYLVANADRLGVATIAFDRRTWSMDQSADGWRRSHPDRRSAGDARSRSIHVVVM
jgi:hypothetical protein